MSRRIAENAKGRKGRDSGFCLLGVVHTLRLVNDNDRAGSLYVVDGRVAVQLVLLLIYHVFGLAKSVNIDNHNFYICARRKLPHIGELRAVVDEIAARCIIVQSRKMLLCYLQ